MRLVAIIRQRWMLSPAGDSVAHNRICRVPPRRCGTIFIKHLLNNNQLLRNQKAATSVVALTKKQPLQLQTTDALATAMMKGAAKCDT